MLSNCNLSYHSIRAVFVEFVLDLYEKLALAEESHKFLLISAWKEHYLFKNQNEQIHGFTFQRKLLDSLIEGS